MNLSVAVLAGGRSRRMGDDKGLVPLDGRPMVEHVLAAVSGLGEETFLITNRPQAYAQLRLRMASDASPGRGSLEGLRTALSAARTRSVLVVGCDMPFLQRPLLEHLAHWKGDLQALVPRYDDRLQPLVAVYRATCLAHVERMLERGQLKLQSVLAGMKIAIVDESSVRQLDPDGLSFFNVNTPQALERATRLIRQGSSAEASPLPSKQDGR